jgi:cytochrome c nitrite reductase small subunit
MRLPLVAALLGGAVVALGAYTFVYAKGYSYLTNDPGACANCHIMTDHHAAWTKSSHRSVAVCNDCHTPPGTAAKYTVKAINGFNHSFAFTTGRFPEPLRITEMNRNVTERACRKCHQEIVEAIDVRTEDQATGRPQPGISCIRCHSTVGHLE